MSVRIGEIKTENGPVLARISASLGGVEVCEATSGPSGGPYESSVPQRYSLQPIEARNVAALFVRAGDECERMRCRNEVTAAQDEPTPTPTILLGQRVIIDAGSQVGQHGSVQGIMRWLGADDLHYVLLDDGTVVCAPFVHPEPEPK